MKKEITEKEIEKVINEVFDSYKVPVVFTGRGGLREFAKPEHGLTHAIILDAWLDGRVEVIKPTKIKIKPIEKKYYTISEAASILSITPLSINYYIKEFEIDKKSNSMFKGKRKLTKEEIEKLRIIKEEKRRKILTNHGIYLKLQNRLSYIVNTNNQIKWE